MFKDIVFEGTCLGCIMKWGENESSGWALQSLPPRLVSNLENYVKHSDNLITDIDKLFHALGAEVKEPLDVLVLLPDLGCIIEEYKFGDTVPMGSQDILPFKGMGRYKLQNYSGEITLNRQIGSDKLSEIDTLKEQDWASDSSHEEQVYQFDWVINNPDKLRQKIIQEFPSLDFDIASETESPIWCAVSLSKGYCDLYGVYQIGISGVNNTDVEAAAESVNLISSAIHQTSYNMSKFRVRIHSSIYDRIAEENISIPSSFLGKDAGLEHPMCVKLSDKICEELQVVKDLEITIFRDNHHLYFTAEAPNTNPVILRVKFEDITNSNGKITSKSLRNSFSKSMGINRKNDGVSSSSLSRIKKSWKEGENKVGSRIGIGLHLSTLNTTFEDKSGRGEKWKLKIESGNALLFQNLAPAMVHLCLARFDPSMRGDIRLVQRKYKRKERSKSNTKQPKYYDWGTDLIRYIVPSISGSISKHWVNSHIRRMKISNARTIDYYRKRDFPLNRIGDETYGFRVIKGHYRGIGELSEDFDYKFGRTPKYYSQKSINWLRYLEKSQHISIQHAERGGELRIPIGESYIQADGWCEKTNTIYEFHGDYWHGNPEKYNPNEMNTTAKKTFGELYRRTIEREELIRELGFNLVVMWESDYDLMQSRV